MPTVTKILPVQKELQKELRDELRTTAAMCCYSLMRSGKAKSVTAQYEYMSSLYHGEEPSIPSNIKMLCDGSYIYKDLYDVVDSDSITSKSDDAVAGSRDIFSLKSSLTRDDSRTYYTNRDILVADLEKKGRNGQQLVSGRNLLDIAKKGTANYRKALSFAVKKFDLEKMEVYESGNTIDDVLEFVRTEMYQIYLRDESIKRKTIVLDSDELDDSKDLEDDYLSEKKLNNEKKTITIQKILMERERMHLKHQFKMKL